MNAQAEATIRGHESTVHDPAYDPDVLSLSRELDQPASAIEWTRVRSETERLLREYPHDLRLATWAVVAAARTDGWNAAVDGLARYAEIIESHWEDAYPPTQRVRARANLAASLWERLASALEQSTNIADAPTIERARDLVTKIEEGLEGYLDHANPSARLLRTFFGARLDILARTSSGEAANHVADAAAAASPAPEAVADEPVDSPPSMREHRPAVEAQTSISDELASITPSVRETIRVLARRVREADPASPWSYRAARTAAWFSIDALPDVESGRTTLRPPSGDERRSLAHLAECADWNAVLEESEEALGRNIFWLDVHRYSARSLGALGHGDAARSVVCDAAAFVARLEGIDRLLFRDATPLASSETRAWLSSHSAIGTPRIAPLAPLGTAQETPGPKEAPPDLPALLTLALGRKRGRESFNAALRAAKACRGEGDAELALMLCEHLLPEVDATLEAWEPDLCADYLATYIEILKRRDGDGALQPSLLRRLFALKPALAMKLRA